MAIEDLIESPKITRVQARNMYHLLQHNLVHREYPDKTTSQMPYIPIPSQVPLKSKKAKDLLKFAGEIKELIK